MKPFTKAIVLTVLMAGALAARAEDKLYAVVNYMHVPVGQGQDDYIALEKLWQRLHQKAVDSGFCRAWYLNRVENGGRNQFVTVEVYDSLDKFANRWPDSMRAGLYNSEEAAKMRRTGDFRILTHGEIWELESSAMESGSQSMPDRIEVDFIKPKPGKGDEYYGMEHNYYQKIHKSRIDAGQMKSWFFMSRMVPHGADGEYSFVTLNGFPEKGATWDNKVIQSALTKEEWQKMPNAGEMRTIVRQEIWHPVLHTTPASK